MGLTLADEGRGMGWVSGEDDAAFSVLFRDDKASYLYYQVL
jgi:hypothetical protein